MFFLSLFTFTLNFLSSLYLFSEVFFFYQSLNTSYIHYSYLRHFIDIHFSNRVFILSHSLYTFFLSHFCSLSSVPYSSFVSSTLFPSSLKLILFTSSLFFLTLYLPFLFSLSSNLFSLTSVLLHRLSFPLPFLHNFPFLTFSTLP